MLLGRKKDKQGGGGGGGKKGYWCRWPSTSHRHSRAETNFDSIAWETSLIRCAYLMGLALRISRCSRKSQPRVTYSRFYSMHHGTKCTLHFSHDFVCTRLDRCNEHFVQAVRSLHR
ncbi:uncharacterized protein LOC143153011 [Ptiloglossa arizonensis]|uniref:uncharacterized protein LOC143153011 n=1 Tax=Ptiloglossa arizonensis TaxID=3350558 RepID=UPI003FA0FFE8